jgi:hypothetical protein
VYATSPADPVAAAGPLSQTTSRLAGEPRGPMAHGTSSSPPRGTGLISAPGRCLPIGSDPAPTTLAIAGPERALARAMVPSPLTPAMASLRAVPDRHLSAITRRRLVRIDLLLIVRRAERGGSSSETAATGGRRLAAG